LGGSTGPGLLRLLRRSAAGPSFPVSISAGWSTILRFGIFVPVWNWLHVGYNYRWSMTLLWSDDQRKAKYLCWRKYRFGSEGSKVGIGSVIEVPSNTGKNDQHKHGWENCKHGKQSLTCMCWYDVEGRDWGHQRVPVPLSDWVFMHKIWWWRCMEFQWSIAIPSIFVLEGGLLPCTCFVSSETALL